jgi:hypothetical protein
MRNTIIQLRIINKEVQNMNESIDLVYFGYESELDYNFTPEHDAE